MDSKVSEYPHSSEKLWKKGLECPREETFKSLDMMKTNNNNNSKKEFRSKVKKKKKQVTGFEVAACYPRPEPIKSAGHLNGSAHWDFYFFIFFS